MSDTPTPSAQFRDAVMRLRRGSSLGPVPVGVAVVAADVIAIAGGDSAWTFWSLLLFIGGLLCVAMAKSARRREALVLTQDDATVRAYLCARLDRSIALASRIAGAMFVPPLLLLGVVHQASTKTWPERSGDALQCYVVAGGLVVTYVYRWLVRRRALVRQRTAIGESPTVSPPPRWLIELTRVVTAAQGTTEATLLWHDVTGANMRAARAAVLTLPDSATPATAGDSPIAPVPASAHPTPDFVSARIRAFARADLLGSLETFAIFCVLVVAENYAVHVSWREFGSIRWDQLTIVQQICIPLATLIFFGAAIKRANHRAALKGLATPMRAYYAMELRERVACASKWQPAGIGLALFLLACIGVSQYRVGADPSHTAFAGGLPRLVEAALIVAWWFVTPVVSKRTTLRRLGPELVALSAASR